MTQFLRERERRVGRGRSTCWRSQSLKLYFPVAHLAFPKYHAINRSQHKNNAKENIHILSREAIPAEDEVPGAVNKW